MAHLYPAPKHGRIIEHFAGSARYSLLHFENEVMLFDTSSFVVEVWNHLIQASKRDILTLPDVPSKVSLNRYTNLTDAERWLIGFHLCRGKAVPRKVGHGQNSWAVDKLRIADNLYKIRHWKIEKSSYKNTPDIVATRFIDPPYKYIAELPGYSDGYPGVNEPLDYDHLPEWIKGRKGLVIACEGKGSDYLPFEMFSLNPTNTNSATTKKNGEYWYIQDSEILEPSICDRHFIN